MLDPNWDPYESLMRAEHQIMCQAQLLANLADQLRDQSHLIQQMTHQISMIFDALATQNKFNVGLFEKLVDVEKKCND